MRCAWRLYKIQKYLNVGSGTAVKLPRYVRSISPVPFKRYLIMSHHPSDAKLPAPCIINTGVIVNKLDMRRLLADLGRVRYMHIQEGKLHSQGEGDVLEVFANPSQSTLVANHALYLNVYSFDYLELKQSPDSETYFDLVQDSRCLRLMPLSTPLQEREQRKLNEATLEAVMDQVLSARWDAEIDDDGACPF